MKLEKTEVNNFDRYCIRCRLQDHEANPDQRNKNKKVCSCASFNKVIAKCPRPDKQVLSRWAD